MVSKKLREKILKLYYNLKFPGSYQGIKTFKESLKDNANINISHSALRKLLKSSLPYQVNIVKPKKFPKRANYSQGVWIQAFCDPIFVPYIPKTKKNDQVQKYKNFLALILVDVHSKYMYSTKLASINPEALKRGFTCLFNNGMPRFSVIRIDKDKSLNKLTNTYFAKKGILVLTRRSVHHLGFLEGLIRNVKRKMIKHMRQDKRPEGWTEKRLEKVLADATESYNSTKNSATGIAPKDCNSPEFDPELRLRLYKDHKIEPFEAFYTETLKLHKKANTPEGKGAKPNFDESKFVQERMTCLY